ncbi:MAG: hypothetical protein R3279_06485 [Putridiphycobacter sp.]|nr:hypothetical protein [Putridiphycobacter sp.]
MTTRKTTLTADQYIAESTSLTGDEVIEIEQAFQEAEGRPATEEELRAMIDMLQD